MNKLNVGLLVAGVMTGAVGTQAVKQLVQPAQTVRMVVLRPDETGAVYVTDSACVLPDGNVHMCMDNASIKDVTALAGAQAVLKYVQGGGK